MLALDPDDFSVFGPSGSVCHDLGQQLTVTDRTAYQEVTTFRSDESRVVNNYDRFKPLLCIRCGSTEIERKEFYGREELSEGWAGGYHKCLTCKVILCSWVYGPCVEFEGEK